MPANDERLRVTLGEALIEFERFYQNPSNYDEEERLSLLEAVGLQLDL
jgi:hypothetical protein